MMNIGLNDSGVDAKFVGILQPQIAPRLYHQLIDRLQCLWGESIESAIEGMVFGYRFAEKVGEATQGIAIVDAFAQFAIVPVLDPHKNEGAQDLGGSQPLASRGRALEPARQLRGEFLDSL